MFNFTEFVADLHNTQELVDIVWEYQGVPAIAEVIPTAVDWDYIIICDEWFNERYCIWTDKLIDWRQDFTMKFVLCWTCKSSKDTMRTNLRIMLKALRDYKGNCVRNIRIDDSRINNILENELQYIIINARIFYN